MSTNSRVGRIILTDEFMANIPEKTIIIEAARRRGDSLSQLIKPISPSLYKIDLEQWKAAYLTATNVYNPNRNLLYNIYDNIGIDNSLSAIMAQRIMDVQQAPFNIIDENGEPDLEAKKLFKRLWFGDFLKHSMTSVFEGPVLIELFDFLPNGEIAKATRVNRMHVKPEMGIVTTLENQYTGTSYLDPVYLPFYIQVGDSKDLGLLYKAAPFVLAKKYALAQWGEYDEKLGIPFRTVNTNNGDSKRMAQLGVIMEEMGSAGWAILREDEKVNLLEQKGADPTKCFNDLINLLTAEYTMLMCGQTATTNSQNNKGTYGSMKALMEISDVIHEYDLTQMAFVINDQLLPRMVQYSPVYAPLKNRRFEWDKSENLSVSEVVDYVVKLAGAGYKPTEEYVTSMTGIPFEKLVPAAEKDKKKSPTALKALYNQKCCQLPQLSAIALPDYEPDVLRVAKAIFESKKAGVVDLDILKKTAGYLQSCITKVFGANPASSDVELVKSLKENIWVFSGFKTHQTLKSISAKLLDENGKTRQFNDFLKEVKKVNADYNKAYLRAEFDNTMVSSQMASQWQEFVANKETLPYLKFVATEDNRTTEICRSLDGITLPVDDPFWNAHMLPLHWGERSLIQQVSRGTVTDPGKIKDITALVDDQIQPMFKNNVGKTGVVFPDTHPYYETSRANARKITKTALAELKKESND